MKYTCLLSFILFPLLLSAQSSSLAKADEHFKNGNWQDAQSIYISGQASLTPEQLFNLGLTYLKLGNTKEGDANAMAWFLKAAAAGNASGMLMLAEFYGTGKAVVKDTTVAYQWLKKAAATKDKMAMYFIGWHNYKGKWTKKNLKEAIPWLEAAYKANYPEAVNTLAVLYYEEKDDANALQWLNKINSNNAAKYLLGNVYRRNKGVRPNNHLSYYYYYSALENKPSRSLRTQIEDTLFLDAFHMIDDGDFKARVNNLLNEFSDGFAGVTGNKLISFRPGIYPRGASGGLGSSGIDMDALHGTLTFYEYPGQPYFLLPYIRKYKPTDPASKDADGLVFSGMIQHSLDDSTHAEDVFDLFAGLLQQHFPQFKYSPKSKKTIARKTLNCSLAAEGTHKGKPVFIDLKLRELGSLYYIELVIKNRRYFRGD